MTRMRFLLPSLIFAASSLALIIPRNSSGTLGEYRYHEPVCDHRSSVGGGSGIDFQTCYLLIFSELDKGPMRDGTRYTWWKWRGGYTTPEYRNLPYPSPQPWNYGGIQAQLDIPGHTEPPYGVNTADSFSLADIRKNAIDLMNKCCKQKTGGYVPVSGNVVHFRIGKYHGGGPWGGPQLQLPGDDDGSRTNDTLTANNSTSLGETTLDPTIALAGF